MPFGSEALNMMPQEDSEQLQEMRSLTRKFVVKMREHFENGTTTAGTIVSDLNWTILQSKPWAQWIRETDTDTIARACDIPGSEVKRIKSLIKQERH